ncbi:MAG: MMPL family transporter [Actinomycetes bacterium]
MDDDHAAAATANRLAERDEERVEARRQPRPPAHRAAGRLLPRAVARAGLLVVALLVWLAIAGTGGPLVGRLSEVQKNDNASFLPQSAESTAVSALAARFQDSQSLPYFLVVERDAGLTPQDLAAVQSFVGTVPSLTVSADSSTAKPPPAGHTLGSFLADEPIPVVPSQDGKAVLVPIPLDADAAATNLPDGRSVVFAAAQTLRSAVHDDLRPLGLNAYVAGPGGVLADFVVAFEGIDGRLLQVTLAVVFVILLLVYRSPILPFAALLSALVALAAAGGVIYPLAEGGVIDLNGQSQGILFILVVGAATDYALLLVSRYREELHEYESKYLAMRKAWRMTVEPVVASASTVILGLLCLLLADLGSTRGLGPVGAIGIASAMLSVLTFLPVLLLWPVIVLGLVVAGAGAAVGAALAPSAGAGVVLGALVALLVLVALAILRRSARRQHAGGGGRHVAPRLDVPSTPLAWYARPPSGRWLFWPRVPRLDHVPPAAAAEGNGIWGRVARLVGRHPRRVWAGTLACLVVLAAFVPTFKASGISQTDLFLDPVESVAGQKALSEHFAGGFGDPAVVVTPVAVLPDVVSVAERTDGVTAAVPLTAGPPGQAGPPGHPADVKTVDGKALVQVTLRPDPGSPEAEEVVQRLRVQLDEVSPDVLVGGSAAANLDVREASDHDLRVVIPAVLLVIFVVLMLLLRALVAPLLLIVANVVSFAATIGTSALVFNHVLDLPGGDPAIPLYAFVFLVALGIDYSIFLMTRVREESKRRGTRPGILVGLAVTGGVITSAGVVLASTFSALVTLPLLFLLQIAFIVAFGVLLDTLVVRSLLVPSLSYDLGRRVWAPSALARPQTPEAST